MCPSVHWPDTRNLIDIPLASFKRFSQHLIDLKVQHFRLKRLEVHISIDLRRFAMFGNWSKRLTALVLLCTCVLNVLAVVNLGIARDQRAQAVHYHVWSSRVTYAKDTERFSNDEIYALAKVAYDEMEKLWETDVIDEWKRPAMMAAMAVGKDVYFSSSIKGSGDKKDDDKKHSTLSFIYEYNELKKNGRDDRSHVVSQKLKACQLALHKEDPATATHHNSHASCTYSRTHSPFSSTLNLVFNTF